MGLYRPSGDATSRPRGEKRCSKVEQLKLRRRAKDVAKCMGELGLCVVDGFLGADLAQALLRDAERMGRSDAERRHEGAATRQWIAEGDAPRAAADELLRRADSMVQACERRLGSHVISGRTKAMLVRYPENDGGRSPCVDNSRNDARCLTCIYYLTKNCDRARDGGQMKVFTTQSKRVATVDPLFDRLVLFWSDRRSVCQLLPAAGSRWGIAALTAFGREVLATLTARLTHPCTCRPPRRESSEPYLRAMMSTLGSRQSIVFWYLTSPTGTAAHPGEAMQDCPSTALSSPESMDSQSPAESQER